MQFLHHPSVFESRDLKKLFRHSREELAGYPADFDVEKGLSNFHVILTIKQNKLRLTVHLWRENIIFYYSFSIVYKFK